MIHKINLVIKNKNSFTYKLLSVLIGSVGIRLTGVFFGLLVGVQLARGLGPAGYGVYGFALSLVSLAAVPTEFGIPQLITREVSSAYVREDWSHIFGILKWAHKIILFSTSALVAISIVYYFLILSTGSVETIETIAIGLVMVPVVALSNVRAAALMGLQQILKGQLPEIILRPGCFCLFIFLTTSIVSKHLTPPMAMFMQVTAAMSALIVGDILLKKITLGNRNFISKRIESGRWLKTAFPMALTEGMRVLNGNVSIIALGFFSTTFIVGVFRVAYSMGMFLAMPVSLVNVISAPILARLYEEKNFRQLQKMLLLTSSVMTFGVLLLVLPFLCFGEKLISILFKADFVSSNTSLLILSVGTLIGACFGTGTILLNMTGKERVVTRVFGLSLILLVGLSAPLSYFFGASGAATANSIAFVFWSVGTWYEAWIKLGLDTSIFYIFRKRI